MKLMRIVNFGAMVDRILSHADQRGGVWLGLMTFQSCLMAWLEGFFPTIFKVPTWWYAFYVVVFTGFTINGTIKSSRMKDVNSGKPEAVNP